MKYFLHHKRVRKWLLFMAFTWSFGELFAQDTLAPQPIREVVVTAQFAPTDVRQTVNSVRVLNRATIEQRAAVNLEELLQTEPNLRLSQDAVLGSALSINGLRGENVKILVDGVPVVGRLNGSVDAGQLPLGAVQQVEIIEGAQSLLYGSDASAGVINLVTRKSQLHRFEAEANTQLESNGYRNLQGRAGAQMGKFLLQITGNQLDFQPQADTSLGRDQLWNPKTQTSGRAMLRYSPSEKVDIRLSGGLFSETVDNLGEIRRLQYKPYAFDDYYQTNRSDATLHGEGWLKNRTFWQTTIGWNRFDRVKNSYRFDLADGAKTLLASEQHTSAAIGLLTRATLATDRRDHRWNFLVGLENYAETAEGIRIVDSTAAKTGRATGNDFALFASAKADFFSKKLTLQGGARWTQNQLYGAAVTPSLWLLWQPTARWQVRFSYANGFRSPGLKELYFNFIDVNHYVVGSPDLLPERSNNFRGEVAWRLQNKTNYALNITASGFHNTVRDRIILSEFAPVQYTYANLKRWETRGGGLGFSATFRDWLRFRSELVVTGFYNAYSEDDAALQTLNWSPDWVNDLTISFFKQKANLNVWHKMTGKTPFFFEDAGAVKQGESQGWDLLNASLGSSFLQRKMRLNVGVKNILNTRQIRSGASDGPGHNGGDLRPVHWGRTFFVSAIFVAATKR
ncbi:MAG: TonB-dependent receptor [Saprospiraceae bacterium]|nr:TonB-dependent receptor [Saprospiraceae bacterium]